MHAIILMGGGGGGGAAASETLIGGYICTMGGAALPKNSLERTLYKCMYSYISTFSISCLSSMHKG